MSTRAVSAVSSRRAKQELVRLLFGKKYRRGGPEAHRKLDPSIYSYSDLKQAYLQRLQVLHPDKLKHVDNQEVANSRNEKFVELQSAWDNYDEVARMLQKVGDAETSNFTMFGVGCSFADSPEERALREEITDQACRGWFSAGSIAESSVAKTNVANDANLQATSLCDDDMFVEVDADGEHVSKRAGSKSNRRENRSLVDAYIRKV